MKAAEKRFSTSFLIPLELRARVDAVRLARGRRSANHPPTFGELVVEALELLVRNEREANK